MTRRTLLLSWLVLCGALVAAVIGYGMHQKYSLLKLLQEPGGSPSVLNFLRQQWAGILIIGVLACGVLLEALRLRWAWFVNCGIYSLAFLSTAGSLLQHHGEHPEEELIAVVFVLIPSAVPAAVTIFLYWFSRQHSQCHTDQALV